MKCAHSAPRNQRQNLFSVRPMCVTESWEMKQAKLGLATRNFTRGVLLPGAPDLSSRNHNRAAEATVYNRYTFYLNLSKSGILRLPFLVWRDATFGADWVEIESNTVAKLAQLRQQLTAAGFAGLDSATAFSCRYVGLTHRWHSAIASLVRGFRFFTVIWRLRRLVHVFK